MITIHDVPQRAQLIWPGLPRLEFAMVVPISPTQYPTPNMSMSDETCLPAAVSIPTLDGYRQLPIETGSTVTFCGANGSGKTRLAVYLEDQLELGAHRISAHRALSLNPRVPKIAEQDALANLRTGTTSSLNAANQAAHRRGSRWRENEAVQLLNDFDYLIQALFAEQSNTALISHRRFSSGECGTATPTQFEKLNTIWDRLLPHRALDINGDDINVRMADSGAVYPSSQLSDGERAIFYLIGQTLVASKDSVLIVDEPELHLHPAVMTALWDELAAARPDCAFFFITHSLEFAATRPGHKYMILDFNPTPAWTFQEVPQDTGFSEDFATLILGSRRPVLFVEGNASSSLDKLIYRSCYPDHFVVPMESSSAVIHAVSSMRANADFTRVSCQGLVDGDHRSDDEIEYLRSRDVHVLAVAEIENLFLLPDVSRAIASSEGYRGNDLDACLDKLRDAAFKLVVSQADRERAVLRRTRRRIYRHLKHLDLSDTDNVDELKQRCSDGIASLDVDGLASRARADIQTAVDEKDLSAFLAHYDNKGLFALAARTLRNDDAKSFRNWLERNLTNGSQPQVIAAIRASLPRITTE